MHQNSLLSRYGNWITNTARTAEDNAVLSAKMLYVSGDNENRGDFKWLIKDINDTASENHKKTLMELILMMACIPNVTDVGFTKADNSSALEKFFSTRTNNNTSRKTIQEKNT